MLKEAKSRQATRRDEILIGIGTSVRAAEARLDAAISSTGELSAKLARSRVSIRAPMAVGMRSLQLLSDAQAALIKAREAYVEAHAELLTAADQIGFDPCAWGDYSDCPPAKSQDDAEVVPAQRSLRAVG